MGADSQGNAVPCGRVSDGGVCSDHAACDASVNRTVAPTTDDHYNTLRPVLAPEACWRMDDLRFDFDSSFVLPSGADEFELLATQRPPETGDGPAQGLLLSVFGHADPSGRDDYNKTLAGRRAMAVYGILVRDVELWDYLYRVSFGGDQWTLRHSQMMLVRCGYAAGEPDGVLGTNTMDATRAFQTEHGVPASGYVDTGTRKKLIEAYMDAICTDANGLPFRYRKHDFLSRGDGTEGKADYQGCGEFNPILVFSQDEETEYKKPAKKAERDADNIPNRRVVVFMFANDLDFPAERWPCPTAKAGPGGCKKQFWRDGDDRRNPKESRREHLQGGRTFACKFYDRLARESPCEAARMTLKFWLLDHAGQRMGANPNAKEDADKSRGAPYHVVAGPMERFGFASAEGLLVEPNFLAGSHCVIEWGHKSVLAPDEASTETVAKTGGYLYQRTFFIVQDGEQELLRELHNLGYVVGTKDDRLHDFAVDYKLADGEPMEEAVHRVHEAGEPRPPVDL